MSDTGGNAINSMHSTSSEVVRVHSDTLRCNVQVEASSNTKEMLLLALSEAQHSLWLILRNTPKFIKAMV